MKGRNDEALSGSNQSLLENSLRTNFNNNMIIIETIDDVMSNSVGIMADILFNTQEMSSITIRNVISSEKYAYDLQDNLLAEFTINKSIVLINTISSKKPTELVDIRGMIFLFFRIC